MIKNLVAGDSKNIKLEIIHNGTPLDISGSTVFFSLKSDKELIDLNANLKKVVTTHSDPFLGKTVIELTHDDTKNLTAGSYYYDIRLKDASGNVLTIQRGKIDIIKPITNEL